MIANITRNSLLVMLAVACSAPTAAAVQHNIDLRIARRGNGTFDLSVSGGTHFFNGGTLVAPDGSTFTSASFSAPAHSNLTLDQLTSRIVGAWTVNDRFLFAPLPPGSVQQHQFTICPFAADLVTETPVITSLTNGQIVSPPINVHWEWPAGFTLPPGAGPSMSYSTGGNVAYQGNDTYVLTPTFDPGVTQRSITISAGSSQILDSKITSITSSVPNPQNSMVARLTYGNYSAPVTVTAVIPEPSTLLLALAGACGIAVARRRS